MTRSATLGRTRQADGVMRGAAEIILDHPIMYRALHTVTGLRRLHARLIGDVFRRYEDRARVTVLDLGCGPGDTLKLIGVNGGYTGIDLNPRYVAHASRQAPAASFIVADVTRLKPEQLGRFDLIVALGLVHHLSDPEADAMLGAASQMLKPGGYLLSLDGCRRNGVSGFTRWLLDHDRGRHVREESAYLAIFARHLQIDEVFTDSSPMYIPYSTVSVLARPSPGTQ